MEGEWLLKSETEWKETSFIIQRGNDLHIRKLLPIFESCIFNFQNETNNPRCKAFGRYTPPTKISANLVLLWPFRVRMFFIFPFSICNRVQMLLVFSFFQILHYPCFYNNPLPIKRKK